MCTPRVGTHEVMLQAQCTPPPLQHELRGRPTAARLMQIGRIAGVVGDVFDNSYYQALLSHQPGLRSDAELVRNDETKAIVEELAADNGKFVREFRDAYVALTSLGYT
jgi:Peroxidase